MGFPGVDIMQKEDDFMMGIFGIFQGKIFGFQREIQKRMKISRKVLTKEGIVVCFEVYFVTYILKMPIECKSHDNVIVSWA